MGNQENVSENLKLAWSTFESLMDLPVTEALQQLALKKNLCSDVQKRVEQLLINLSQPHPQFDALANAFMTRGTSVLTDLSGQTIGSYVLIELIGQGGMSSVYSARRNDSDIQKKVAIKIMHPYSVSAISKRLFNREQLALALLNHPNIISFHHGGCTTEGTPFLVTDFIADAQGINTYIETKKLTKKVIIKLFVKVLNAISYAHANLVIHRDLKPSNLLVDANGQVLVVDFGLATLDVINKEHTTLVFTPEYAAPEQLYAQTITTQADVFSLGVVLLGLLTKAQPLPEFKLRMADSANDEKHISTVLMHSNLDADLKHILLQATQVDIKQRYLSVVDFRQDLLNWLQHKPIMATKKTVIYRFNKFIIRNTAVSILLSLVFISLVIGLMTTLHQKSLAQHEAAKAKEVKQFLLDALSSSDPDVAAGKDLNVRDLLLTAQVNLSQQALHDNDLQAELLLTIGTSLGKIGEYELAIKLLEQAKILTKSQSSILEIDASIVDLLFDSKQYDAAVSGFQDLWSASSETSHHTFQLIKLRVKQKSYLGEYQSAEKVILEHLAGSNAGHGNQIQRIELTRMLASVYISSNKYLKAEKLLQQTLALSTEFHGEVHSKTIANLLDLAEFYENQTDQGVEKSLLHLQHAMLLQNQLYQAAHPKIVSTLIRIANIHKALGQNQAAFESANRAKSMATQLYGVGNILAARADVSLSHLSLKSGNLNAAIEQLQAAVKVYEKHYGTDHFETNQYKTNLATYLLKAGEAKRALNLLDELFTQQTQQLGTTHMATLYVQLNRIKAMSALGTYQNAIKLGQRVLSICEQELGGDHVITVGVELALGVAYYENKQYLLAFDHLSKRESSAIVKSNDSYHKGLLLQLATAALHIGKLSQAQKYYATLRSEYSGSAESLSEIEQSEFNQLGLQIANNSALKQ